MADGLTSRRSKVRTPTRSTHVSITITTLLKTVKENLDRKPELFESELDYVQRSTDALIFENRFNLHQPYKTTLGRPFLFFYRAGVDGSC